MDEKAAISPYFRALNLVQLHLVFSFINNVNSYLVVDMCGVINNESVFSTAAKNYLLSVKSVIYGHRLYTRQLPCNRSGSNLLEQSIYSLVT